MRKKRPQDCFGRWTEGEDDLIRDLFLRAGGVAEIMEATGRTRKAVRFRVYRLGFRGPNNQRRVTQEKFNDPPPARVDLLESMKCPGKGNGCGNLLWEERVLSAYGYIVPGEFDLRCAAGHRFRAT